MEFTEKPQIHIATKVLPKPLYKALQYIFQQKLSGCALTGGTALAGFYAGHRKSDDLDLFTKDGNSFEATVRAVKSLESIGTIFQDEFRSAQYYRALCTLEEHSFTVDVVLDSNFFRVGNFETLENNIIVADLKTICMTKIATLVSRCSEKDLYDLLWIFEHAQNFDWKEFLEFGNQIDAGVHGEAILMGVGGAQVKKEACDFAMAQNNSPEKAYQEICAFQEEIILNVSLFLKNKPALDLIEVVKRIRRMK